MHNYVSCHPLVMAFVDAKSQLSIARGSKCDQRRFVTDLRLTIPRLDDIQPSNAANDATIIDILNVFTCVTPVLPQGSDRVTNGR